MVSAIVLILLAQFIHGLVVNPGWDWPTFAQYFTAKSVLAALWVTIKLTLWGTILGFGLGVVLALGRLSNNPVLQVIAWTRDGEMWASEFGQDTWDELNHIVGGTNYGSPSTEGQAGDGRFSDPVVAWPTSEASPSGIAAVGDTVFVTGLRGERLWVVDVSVSSTLERDATVGMDGQGRLRDVVAAPDGTLWILTNNTDGRGTPRTGDDVLIRLPIAPAA